MGQSTSSSNIGLSLGTGATSRIIAFSAGAILVLLAFVPKLSMIFVIMPATVMGAALVFVAAFMIVTGLQIITSRMMDARKTFVVGVSFIVGFSVDTLPGIYAGAPAMIQPVFSSSLAAAAITALLLNLVFRIGIVKRKVIELEPGTDFSDKIFTFFEKEGGMWGARKEVITRAVSAMTEFMESATFLGLTREKIRAEVLLFDEYSLDVEMRYVGKPLDLSPTARPTDEDLIADESALTRLSTYLICRSADGVSTESKDGLCVVRFHFDH